MKPHRATREEADQDKVRLSNKGLQIYREFDKVIILTTCHRINYVSENAKPLTEEEQMYNLRADRFMHTLHRLRDLQWTTDDYHWLMTRKRGMLSMQDQLKFQDAIEIMDFRRKTEDNPDNNCTAYNHAKVRKVAKSAQLPVVQFDALHDGTDHKSGANTDDR